MICNSDLYRRILVSFNPCQVDSIIFYCAVRKSRVVPGHLSRAQFRFILIIIGMRRRWSDQLCKNIFKAHQSSNTDRAKIIPFFGKKSKKTKIPKDVRKLKDMCFLLIYVMCVKWNGRYVHTYKVISFNSCVRRRDA